MAKNHGERIASLETSYAQTVSYFQDIKEHLAKQNGTIASISRWQQRVIGAGIVLGVIVSATAGTMITLLATQVL